MIQVITDASLRLVGLGVFGLGFSFFDLGGLAVRSLLGRSRALVFSGSTSSSAGLKFVDAAFDIEDTLFTGEEGMRSRGNVHFDQRIFIAVIPFGGFFGGGRLARDKAKPIIEVLKYDESVVIRM
jgi:hypothetical protein